MTLRSAAGLVGLAAMLIAPAGADAASVAVNQKCYGGGDRIEVKGTGYQPASPVGFTVDGRPILETATTDPGGAFSLSFNAPFTTQTTRRTQTLGATSTVNPALTDSTAVKLSIVRVRVRPQRGKPSRVRRIRATGFTNGRTLYAHKTRGSANKTIKVGKLVGDCRSLSVRRKLFAPNAKVGTYRIQFDAHRRFRRTRAQKVVFQLEIFRNSRASGARAASAGSGTGPLTASAWRRVD